MPKPAALPKPGTLSFDFNRAVRDARRDYPAETKNITFIDTSREDAAAQLAAYLKNTASEFKKIFRLEDPALEAAKILLFFPDGACVPEPISGKSCLLAPSALPTSVVNLPLPKSAAFLFHHELGHLITAHGIARTKQDLLKSLSSKEEALPLKNTYELNADCFSVLKGLRDGFLDAADVEKIISLRTNCEKLAPEYRTAPALKALLEDYDAEKTARLTPMQLKAAAEKHAATFAP